MKSTRVLLTAFTALVLTATAATAAPCDVQTVTALDYAAGEHPEGLAVARDGSLYVGMAPTGQLARVALDGEVTPLGAPAFPAESGYLLGLALDDDEQVYGAVVRFDGGPTGVWRYDAREHRLLRVRTGDLRALTGTLDFAATAPLNLLYGVEYDRTQRDDACG
jgi:sugar lactone lactonase YvrE